MQASPLSQDQSAGPTGFPALAGWVAVLICAALVFRHGLMHAVMGVGVLAALGLVWMQRQQLPQLWQRARFPGLILLLALTLWQILATYMAPSQADLFGRSGLRYQWVIIPVLCLLVSHPQVLQRCRWALPLSGLLAVGLAILQYYIGLDRDAGPWRVSSDGGQYRAAVAFQNRHWLAGFIFAIAALWALPLAWRRQSWWRCALALLVLALLILGLMLSSVRAVAIGLLPAMALWALLRAGSWRQRGLLAGAMLVLGGLAFWGVHTVRPLTSGQIQHLHGRDRVFAVSWHLIRQEPLWGVGRSEYPEAFFAAIPEVYPELSESEWVNTVGHPHNEWLALAGYYGIPAALLFALFLLRLLYWAWQVRRESPEASAGMVALVVLVLVAGIAENYFDYSATAYAAFATMAVLFLQQRRDQQAVLASEPAMDPVPATAES